MRAPKTCGAPPIPGVSAVGTHGNVPCAGMRRRPARADVPGTTAYLARMDTKLDARRLDSDWLGMAIRASAHPSGGADMLEAPEPAPLERSRCHHPFDISGSTRGRHHRSGDANDFPRLFSCFLFFFSAFFFSFLFFLFQPFEPLGGGIQDSGPPKVQEPISGHVRKSRAHATQARTRGPVASNRPRW
jgi:hypothetical protein